MNSMKDYIAEILGAVKEIANLYSMTGHDRKRLLGAFASICHYWAESNACACAEEIMLKENGVDTISLLLPMERFNELMMQKMAETLPDDDEFWGWLEDDEEDEIPEDD